MVLDKKKTMAAYKARLRKLPTSLFKKWFDQKWISSLVLQKTIPAGRTIPNGFKKFYPVQAYLVAIEKGAKPLGLTTDRTRNGVYLCDARKTIQNEKVQYIGKYSYFTGHTLRKKDNPFALQTEDRRTAKPGTRDVCLHYNFRSSSQNSTN